MGENGAGKTMLMNYILNETMLYEGYIYIEGIDIQTERAQALNHIGFVSEENSFFAHCTCRENAKLFGVFYEKYEKNTFYQMMDAMNLPAGKIYGKMPRGERLKFQLAFAIARSPSLFLMSSYLTTEIETRTDYVGVMEKGGDYRMMEQRQQELLDRFFQQEKVWCPGYVISRMVAGLCIGITMLLLIMPAQIWEGEFQVLFFMLVPELIGIQMFLNHIVKLQKTGK